MLTLRALPGRGAAENLLMTAYHDGLRQHWPIGRRVVARMLDLAAQGGWSRGERRLLGETVCADGLSMRDRKGLHRLLNPGAFPLLDNPLKNKQLFAAHVREAGLPAPDGFDPERGPLPDWLGLHDVIIAKPSYRSKGQGVERFVRKGTAWSGLSEARLIAHLHRLAKAGGVIQPCLNTHPALRDISPTALPTLRVVTCLDERGEPEMCDIVLRLSAGGPRPVDNFNAGNLALAVDADGVCGAAYRGSGRHDRHPRTGGLITGRVVPGYGEAVALACEAHRRFRAGFTVIGWDIGLTDRGPALIEGNWNPGTDIMQLVGHKGLAQTRLGALYRHHLAILPVDRWRNAGAVETEPRRL